mgnify:CR=1 FL=1
MDTLLVPRKFEVSVKENVYPHVGLYTAMERTFTHLLACKPQWRERLPTCWPVNRNGPICTNGGVT